MPKFYTEWDNVSVSSEPGCPSEPVYERLQNDKTGALECRATGVDDVQERIQLAGEGCLLTDTISRYMSGDDSALGSVTGIGYGDVSEIPHNYIEALEMQNRALMSAIRHQQQSAPAPAGEPVPAPEGVPPVPKGDNLDEQK